MANEIQYYEWKKLNARLVGLENKLKVFQSVQEGIKEVKAARMTNQKLQTLSEFLNESRS